MVETRQADPKSEVWDRAVKLLSMRMHTRKELERKLLAKKFDRSEISKTLARLDELKLLNDEQFGEIFLGNLIRYKTFGYYGLKAKLLSRGIDDSLVEKLLDEHVSLEIETKIAQKVVAKNTKDKQKLSQSLARRGFRSAVIANIVQNMV